jgi:hypothetical protein
LVIAKSNHPDDVLHTVLSAFCPLQVAVATARGCVRRCFAAWLVLARERWWKTQMSSMESQVALLEAKVRGYEKRPIQVRAIVLSTAVPQLVSTGQRQQTSMIGAAVV